jgi:hypothetical protein
MIIDVRYGLNGKSRTYERLLFIQNFPKKKNIFFATQTHINVIYYFVLFVVRDILSVWSTKSASL